jgi:hypothetical protein
MTRGEASKYADIGVAFYVTRRTNLGAITNNLAYYGLVRDGETLKYALEHTTDTTLGRDGAIKVGSQGTIDLAYYDLSREMDAWQIADVLLNKPHYFTEDYGYLFMPGDPKGPTTRNRL